MKILSLFDGISIAQQAITNLGYTEDEIIYYASEIDKYATQIACKNFPNTIHLGDVRNVGKETKRDGLSTVLLKDIDILIGGSPCQDLSIAKKDRKGLSGERSGLFYEYLRILKEVKPKYFILENVNSMPKEAKQIITDELFGIEPVMINAALVSAQNRKRLFWVGKLVGDTYEYVKIELPEDKGILLRDILESEVDEKYYVKINEKYGLKGLCEDNEKSKSMTATMHKGYGNDGVTTVRIGSLNSGGQGDRIYSQSGKSVALSANGGGRGAKTGLYAVALRNRGEGKKPEVGGDKANSMTTVQTDSMVIENEQIRKLTPLECERLQSLPDNYTEGVSNTQRYKACGNGFNCKVIEHIIKHLQ